MAKKMKRASADQTRCFVEKIVFNNILLPRLLYAYACTGPEVVKVVLLLQSFKPVIGRRDPWVRRLKICSLKI